MTPQPHQFATQTLDTKYSGTTETHAFFHFDVEFESQFIMASVLFIFFTSLVVAISAACNLSYRLADP